MAAVYRAVAPDKIDSETGEVTPEAFHLRSGEQFLSVYSADHLTPRDVLQKIIGGRLAKLASKTGKDREAFERYLHRNGDTVERLLEVGWKVIKLPIALFATEMFHIGEIEADGHINIQGDREDFEVCALEWTQPGVAELVQVE